MNQEELRLRFRFLREFRNSKRDAGDLNYPNNGQYWNPLPQNDDERAFLEKLDQGRLIQ
jgi:hypothetical protein